MQGSALSSCVDDCFGAIGMSRRGRLSSTKIANSDTRGGSFSGVRKGFADTKRLRRGEPATS